LHIGGNFKNGCHDFHFCIYIFKHLKKNWFFYGCTSVTISGLILVKGFGIWFTQWFSWFNWWNTCCSHFPTFWLLLLQLNFHLRSQRENIQRHHKLLNELGLRSTIMLSTPN
jgi:hypothetical protein